MPDTQISDALGLIDGGLQLLLAAVHADDPKREMLVRVGDLLRDVRSLEAALSGHVVVPREPLNDLIGRLRFEREINKQRISGTDWNFYLEPLGFPAPPVPEMEG